MALLSHHDFKVQGDQMLFCRIALLQAMLTSKKSVDGYSKLIVKSDFDKLSRTLQSKAIEMEKILKEAWVKLQGESHEPSQKAKAFGKLCVRMVLLVLSKQKHGRDPEFEGFKEVTEAFAEDLLGQVAPAPKASSASSKKKDTIENLVLATQAQVAALQNSHLEIDGKHLALYFHIFISLCCPVEPSPGMLFLFLFAPGICTRTMGRRFTP